MMVMLILCLISCLLVFLLKLVSLFLSEKSLLQREELSAYECGFEHHNVSRVPFSLRYFFLTLLFLLFDLEIILMLFLPYFVLSSNFFFLFFLTLLFLFILYASLIYEWNDGSLEWLS